MGMPIDPRAPRSTRTKSYAKTVGVSQLADSVRAHANSLKLNLKCFDKTCEIHPQSNLMSSGETLQIQQHPN
jgi:hypothetical protein